ncbi:MAG: hypothetical protein ACRDJ9_20695, partial [Dehalococcoidia bacterium]
MLHGGRVIGALAPSAVALDRLAKLDADRSRVLCKPLVPEHASGLLEADDMHGRPARGQADVIGENFKEGVIHLQILLRLVGVHLAVPLAHEGDAVPAVRL